MPEKRSIPLSVPNLSMDIVENIKDTIESGWVSTGGKFIKEFQEKMEKYLNVERAVAVQSGTAGLHLAVRVLGVDRDDEVIVPTATFIAAVNPVTYMGAEPVFMDCGDDINIDPDKLESFLANQCKMVDGKVINKKTDKEIKAVVVVHVFGNPADMERIMKIGAKYNLKIVEDATEALGSYYTSGKYQGQHCGTIGDIGVYSFNANKIITTGGGGMMVANHPELLEKASFLGVQAKTDPLYYQHDEIGYNYRMTNIQAAYGTEQIDRLEDFIATKKKNYKLYKKAIAEIDGLSLLPFNQGTRANHWFYAVIVDQDQYGIDRDELLRKLNEVNIQARPLWGLIHQQKPYLDNQAYQIEKAQYFVDHLINIPCSSNLTEEEVEIVVEWLKEFKK
ncbi:aminotransferase, LLPSF_NHT_00031 family [Halanaerobium congolense]|jgi:aminotransferase in exopolysaccharide biosynthesis|uniref:Aminotransferase, LLPSF_NHT_00031 family n=1 Tax=Halanaerobium congolense TaxID=54121 RepID=A0A1G8QB99_9FIRM|nr:LegC family aminotransferase [Halanaerobium congolense]PUU88384.1 MAG: DegT/DnrJ/EryC1/StrS aminotransferase [Halanaerobium sp.]SDJ01868.1 aminotransferase, LLPSF_NHT_00031 family [Halanaerobium congolense]SET67250.1 aminotransferase, LLPSF_NHT_00031 family [Halanaerobium congolense]